MTLRKTFYTLIVVSFFGVSVAGCGGGSVSNNPPPPPVVAQSVSISPSAASAQTGATQQFTATESFSDGSKKDVTASATWSSSNPSAATISNAVSSKA